MNELGVEILLRLSKVVVAAVLAVPLYLVLTGPLGAGGGPELALGCWMAGGIAVLLVQDGTF